MSTRYPAAARSSSDSPPQKPYSRFSRAQSRHSRTTGQIAHTARALPSRTSRASGRSPAGAKNSSVRPWHAASAVQASGPLKIRLETDSTTATASLPQSVPQQEGRARGVGGGLPALRVLQNLSLTADVESVQQLGLIGFINVRDGKSARSEAWESWSCVTSTRCWR